MGMDMKWRDGRRARGRRAWLILVAGGTCHLFAGSDIPEVVGVLGASYTRDGKWSSTTYRLSLFPPVRAIDGTDGWNGGSFREGLSAATSLPVGTWSEMANALGVAISEARRFVGHEWPRDAEELDRVEAVLSAVADAADAAAVDTAEAVLTFGNPTNRQRENGWWTLPVLVVDSAGTELGRITPAVTQYPDLPEGWDKPVAAGTGVGVISSERSAGPHGGYVSLRAQIPQGARMVPPTIGGAK